MALIRSGWLVRLCLLSCLGAAFPTVSAAPSESESAACANVAAETEPGLAADCETLLGLRDELRGGAELNWSAERPIAEWSGLELGGEPRRVVGLELVRRGLDGAIPAALGELDGLRRLRLSDNRLGGGIPPELGRLERLILLALDDNELTGAPPPALGGLARLESLDLSGNRLAGALPGAWAELWSLRRLALLDNRLAGTAPLWLADFGLESLELSGNAGLEGCLPDELSAVDYHDLERLGLDWCAPRPLRSLRLAEGAHGIISPVAGRHLYPEGARVRLRALPRTGYRVASWSGTEDRCAGRTPVCVVRIDVDRSVAVWFEQITYSLTVSANEGGTVTPTGTTNYTEPTTVTLQASWNDATHSFTGWSGDCIGTTSTCELEVDDDLAVTATFAELPAERCSTPTAPDCIRAVYLGAPDDHRQVADIPETALIPRGAYGRYTIGRDEQITVVTAAPLPSGQDRFVANIRPDADPAPTAHLQLVRPIGTTFSLSASADAYAADRFGLDLHAARNRRGGGKPIPGDVVVTAQFSVRPAPLTLELTSSRELCTANTLTELSWTITGGKPPYTLTIDGQAVDAEAASHRVNCGPLNEDPAHALPGQPPAKRFSAVVSDSNSETAAAVVDQVIGAALTVPTDVGVLAFRISAGATWQAPARATTQGPITHYLVRWKRAGASIWAESYQRHSSERHVIPQTQIARLDHGSHYHFAVAAMRDPIEAETPNALQWTSSLSFYTLSSPTGIRTSSTHDSITVRWDAQTAPRVHYSVTVGSEQGGRTEHVWFAQRDSHVVTIGDLPPDTEHRVIVTVHAGEDTVHVESPAPVRTTIAPTGWQAPTRGPTQLTSSATQDSIAVSWQHPRPDAPTSYIVYLFDASSETRPLRHLLIHDGTAVQFEGLIAGQSYRVKVVHLDGVSASRELRISTLKATGTDGAARSRARQVNDEMVVSQAAPRFGWPVNYDAARYLTEDMWDWRTSRHHGGMDIGHERGGAYVESRKDPLIASADGVIRLFNEDALTTHYFCPALSGPFHQRFLGAGDPDLVEPHDRGECNYVATSFSGVTAIIVHGANGEGPYITKYAHISEVDLEPGVLARPVHGAGQDPAFRIRQGERIGYIGGTGGYVPHVHFEIRRMPSTPGAVKLWYGTGPGSMKCAGAPPYNSYCGWHPERFMISFLDPEELLPPHAPSWPRNSTRAFQVHAVERTDGDEGISIVVRAQADTPRFYSPGAGSGDRRHLVGLAATRPGITRYFLDTLCESRDASTEYPRVTNATDGVLNRTLRLGSPSVCDFQLGSLNPTYRYTEPQTGSYGRLIDLGDNDDLPWGTPVVIRPESAEPRSPSATLSLAPALLRGTELLSGPRTVIDDDIHLFAFIAVPGLTYRFCATLGGASTECLDESLASSVTELLIVGPGGTGQSGVVTAGLTRGPTGLEWRVPDPTDATVETYAVVVRRRARYEGGDVAAHSFRLKYTIPEPTPCSDLSIAPFFCTPTTPSLNPDPVATHDSITVYFTASAGATGYRLERVGGGETVEETAAADATSHTFSGLDSSTQYSIRVQGYNSAAESAWSGSRTVRTLSLPFCSALGGEARDGSSPRSAASCRLGLPVGLSVGDVTAASARVSWSSGDPQTSGYRLSLDGRPLDPQPDLRGATSHTFAGLSTATTEHVFGVIATGTGVADSEPANLTLLLPPRLTAPTATQNTLRTTWTTDPRATGYQVKLGAAGTIGLAESDSGHTFRGLASDTAFELYVRARNAQGESAWRSVRGRTNPQVGCPPVEQRPARPTASESETVSISTDWVVGDTKADEIRTTIGRTRTRTVSWLAAPECRWQTGEWQEWVSSTTATTLRTLPRPADRTRVNEDENGDPYWTVSGGTACEWQDWMLQPQRNQAVFSEDAEAWAFHESGWADDGPPTTEARRTETPCIRRPADRTRVDEDESGASYWIVSGGTACEWQRWTLQPQRNQAEFSAADEAWQFHESGWADDGAPTADARRTRTPCKDRPHHYIDIVPIEETTETRWERREVIVCLEYEQERIGHRQSHYLRPYVWNAAATEWQVGPRNPSTPVFTHPPGVYSFGAWKNTGTTRLCPLQRRSEGAVSADLPAGDYIMQWGEVRFAFTVPAGASVTLTSRVEKSGVEAAVFSVESGAELVVDPSTLSTDAAANASLFLGVTDTTLSQLGATLQRAQTSAASVAEASSGCVAAVRPDEGGAGINLGERTCALVPGGGALVVSKDDRSLSLTLPAGRDWMLVRNTMSDGALALTLVDLASGGFLTLSFADARELARQSPEGNTELASLFTAILAGASAVGSGTGEAQ